MGEALYSPFLSGLFLGGSLIIAIGAQNAFILRQGLLRQHVFILCLICSLSDALLISAGVAGLGTLVSRSPALITAVTVGGAIFLFTYAFTAFRRATHPDALHAAKSGPAGFKASVGACLAFTFLNPHVYLDTMVLLGGLSTRYPGSGRWAFAAGASLASVGWFTALGYGSRLLAPVFRSPRAWRALDALVALVMGTLCLLLLARPLPQAGP